MTDKTEQFDAEEGYDGDEPEFFVDSINLPYDEFDDLVESTDVGPRIFTLSNASGTTMLGVLMEETQDSFLVGLPSTLNDENGDGKNLVVKPFVHVLYMRLMKANVIAVMHLFNPFRDKYMEYLMNEGVDIYPELIENITENAFLDKGSFEDVTDMGDEEIDFSSEMEDVTIPMSEETRVIEDKLKEASEKGSIVPGSDLKH